MNWILAIVLIVILALLAFLHLYWAFGGRWGSSAVIPTIPSASSKPLFQPGMSATLVVAVALLFAATLVVGRVGWVGFLPMWMTAWGVWGIAAVFLLRAIGEFRYVGFFKRVNGTAFARLDTLIYSPLCLLMAVLAAGTALS